MFAKLFQDKYDRQLLVKRDTNDDGAPEIRIYFEPEGLGVCSMALSFKDTETGWENADKVFDQIDEAGTVAAIENICQDMGVPIDFVFSGESHD